MRLSFASSALPPLPLGRGREAMTYGCVAHVQHAHHFDGAAVSHSAELVRGNFISDEGPLIRSFGPPSPQGEKGRLPRAEVSRRAGTRRAVAVQRAP